MDFGPTAARCLEPFRAIRWGSRAVIRGASRIGDTERAIVAALAQLDDPELRLQLLDACVDEATGFYTLVGGRKGRFNAIADVEIHVLLQGVPSLARHVLQRVEGPDWRVVPLDVLRVRRVLSASRPEVTALLLQHRAPQLRELAARAKASIAAQILPYVRNCDEVRPLSGTPFGALWPDDLCLLGVDEPLELSQQLGLSEQPCWLHYHVRGQQSTRRRRPQQQARYLARLAAGNLHRLLRAQRTAPKPLGAELLLPVDWGGRSPRAELDMWLFYPTSDLFAPCVSRLRDAIKFTPYERQLRAYVRRRWAAALSRMPPWEGLPRRPRRVVVEFLSLPSVQPEF